MRQPCSLWIPLAFALATVGAVLPVPTAHAQTLYPSIGPDGAVSYSDQRPSASQATRTQVLKPPPVGTVPGMPARPPVAASADALPPPVDTVLYMARWCGYCRAAKAYMEQRRIPYREIDIDTPAGRSAFAQLGARGVPVLLTQGQRVSGFSGPSYDAVFTRRTAR